MLGLIFTATVLGVVAGLFGIFLRTCMLEDMIFYPWYKLLSKWVGVGDYADARPNFLEHCVKIVKVRQ